MNALDIFSILSCKCRHRDRSPREVDKPEILASNLPDAKPASSKKADAKTASSKSASKGGSLPSGKKPEDRVCPITGAVGYCPMARPPPGTKLEGPKPELKVMLLLLWEEDDSKVSIGIYPHLNQHWAALELPDTSTKQEIKAQFHKLSIRYHPDKNHEDGAKERFQKITEAYQALKDVDGELAFPWEKYPERQSMMTGAEVLKTFGPLASEAGKTDPIKAQMMQHVIKESTDCKVLMYTQETVDGDIRIQETWADGLCEDTRNGSNHLVKVYRRIASIDD